MSNLRDEIIRLAFENPSLRGELLPLVRESASWEVVGKVNDRQVVLTVEFAGYGRMHDITNNMKRAHNMLDKLKDSVRDTLDELGAFWDQSEVYFAPTGNGRQMDGEVYWSIKGDKLTREEQEKVKASVRHVRKWR